jgi:2-keto-4-pentenoate hydratase/2-oxohepta-3-ene-1,7-dioic acid hydratase in catechol pathway
MRNIIFNQNAISPGKIVCIGQNYAEHIKELGSAFPESMVLFAKPNSAIAEGLRFIDENCHYECEISFVVQGGQFAGVGMGLDLTKRALQSQLKKAGLPWERAKAFDGAAVFGEFVPLQQTDIDALHFELFINGELRQEGGVADMIHKPAGILQEIQAFMTLDDGDVVMTGTPKGVGSYAQGDRFYVKLHCGAKLLCEASWIAE